MYVKSPPSQCNFTELLVVNNGAELWNLKVETFTAIVNYQMEKAYSRRK